MKTDSIILPVILLICCIPFFSEAQTLHKITGYTKNTEGKPVPFANVVLLKAQDSAMVTGQLSGENGNYAFEKITEGAYIVVSSMVGYSKTSSKIISIEEHSGEVKTDLILEVQVNQLSEVEVITKKPLFEQQIDRLVVNVENSITAVGGSVLDALAKSPGVTVNKQNMSISMNGKQGVLVMIDGKINRLPMDAIVQMLSGMNTSNIEKIELITTPPAKYDSEGDAGIINIVTKKNAAFGTNGSYSLFAGYGFHEKYGGAFNINHRRKKLNLYADYSYNHDDAWQEFKINRSVTQGGYFTTTDIITTRRANENVHDLRLGGEYSLSKKTSVSIGLSGYDNMWKMIARNVSDIQNDTLKTHIHLRDQETNHWQNITGSINLNHSFSDRQDLSFEGDYYFYYDNNPHNYLNTYDYEPERQVSDELINISKKTPIHMWVARGDYSIKPDTRSHLEFGVKGAISTLKNDVLVTRSQGSAWAVDSRFSQNYFLEDNVIAAYGNYKKDLTEKTTVQAGLRTERTYMRLYDAGDSVLFNLNFWSLFPTAYFSHKINKSNELQFAYGRRITRPRFTHIAPYVTFLDPNTFYSGNPNLKPTISNSIESTYKVKEAWIFTLRYNYDKNFIAQYQNKVDAETNQSTSYTSNMDHVHTSSLNISLPLTITNWWTIQNNMIGVYQLVKTREQNEDVQIDQIYGRINSAHTFLFPRDFSAELVLYFVTPYQHGLSKSRQVGDVTLGIQKKLPKDKGTITFNVSDLFWTDRFYVTYYGDKNSTSHFSGRFEPRIFRLTYSRNFGNKSIKDAVIRSGSDEDRSRVGAQ